MEGWRRGGQPLQVHPGSDESQAAKYSATSPEPLGKEPVSPQHSAKRMFLIFLRGGEQGQGWGKQRGGG